MRTFSAGFSDHGIYRRCDFSFGKLLWQIAIDDFKLRKLFALTTHAAHWFIELGFRPGDVSALPSQRQTMYNWRRGSKVFFKRI